MILFAETDQLIAYKEIVGEHVRVVFETIHSETFTLSAQRHHVIDMADELFKTGLNDYLQGAFAS